MRQQSAKIGMNRTENGMLDDLAVFVEVAKHTSFVAAAKQLARPPSTVSRSVARLEGQLGVLLLRRTSRTVVVTDEGQQLLDGSAAHLEGLNEALAVAKDLKPEPEGVVRVTAPAFTGSTRVTRSLAAFAAKYPRVSIELDASNAMHDLLRDGYDFGIRVGAGVVGEFIARKLWQGQLCLCASRGFVHEHLDGRQRISRQTIDSAPCVVLRTPAVWRFRDAKQQLIEVQPRTRFAVNDPRAMLTAAKSGLGMTLVPADAFAADRRGLVELEPDFGKPEPSDLFVVYPTRRLLPSRVRLAIDWLMADVT